MIIHKRCVQLEMKANIIFYSLLVFSLQSIGQDIDSYERRLKVLLNPTSVEYDTTGYSLLPAFSNYCGENDSKEFEFYKVIDLDDDGLLDLVFSGPCIPYYQTIVFLNRGDRLEKVFDIAGEVISIDDHNGKRKIDISLEACCCSHNSYLEELVFGESGHSRSRSIKYHGTTELEFQPTYKTDEISGVLRSHPVVDDNRKKDPCSESFIEGNVVGKIEEPETVIELSASGKWKLVLSMETEYYSTIGWIRSK